MSGSVREHVGHSGLADDLVLLVEGPAGTSSERWSPDGTVTVLREASVNDRANFDVWLREGAEGVPWSVTANGSVPLPDLRWMWAKPEETPCVGLDVAIEFRVTHAVTVDFSVQFVMQNGELLPPGAKAPGYDLSAEVEFIDLVRFATGRLWLRELVGRFGSIDGELLAMGVLNGVVESPEAIGQRRTDWVTEGTLRLCRLSADPAYQCYRSEYRRRAEGGGPVR